MVIENPCEASASTSGGGGDNGRLLKQRAGLRRLSARANAERSSSILASALAAASAASSTSSLSSSLGASSSSSSGEAAAAAISSQASKGVVFSFSRLGHELANHLRACGVPLGPGLSATELERIEALLGFAFPPEFRGLLEAAVPFGPGFPDWRSSSPASQLRAWMDLPAASLCAAVDATEFWCVKAFGGPRPSSPPAAVAACLASVRRRFPPPMVPIFGGFFIPSLPSRAGNPVFYFDRQGRLACCGGSLQELVRRGFSPGAWPRPEPAAECGSKQDGGDDGDEDDPFRRWSTSDLVRSRSMGMEERSRSLPGRLQKAEGDGSWGRKLDALASTALAQLKKSIPPPVTMANAPPLDPMPSSLSQVIQNLLTSSPHSRDAVGSPRRRIEFWSDVVDRMVVFHQQRTWVGERDDDDEDLVLSLSWCLSPQQQQQQRQHHSRAASISTADSTPMKDDLADGGGGDGDGRKWVSTVLGDVAARLRRGGWKEEEIVEMVDASSPRSVLGQQHQEAGRDSSTSTKDEFLHLVVDREMLQKVGFSAEELGSLVLVE